LYSENLTQEVLEGFGGFKCEKMYLSLKYADDPGQLDEDETVLQGMIERLTENECGKY